SGLLIVTFCAPVAEDEVTWCGSLPSKALKPTHAPPRPAPPPISAATTMSPATFAPMPDLFFFCFGSGCAHAYVGCGSCVRTGCAVPCGRVKALVWSGAGYWGCEAPAWACAPG